MTAGEPTPPDFDFEAFERSFGEPTRHGTDAGLLIFEDNRRTVEDELNANGGIMSPLYQQVLDRLNETWEMHEQVATVCGRIYLYDDHEETLNWLTKRWGEPLKDDAGKVYWVRTDEQLVSDGVYDINRRDEDNEVVAFAYVFYLKDDDDDEPQVMVTPDSAVIEYDFATDAEVRAYLQTTYPEVLSELEDAIEMNSVDYTESIHRLSGLVDSIQDLIEDDRMLGTYISRHATSLLHFSKVLSCVLEIKPGTTFELQDHNGSWIPAEFPDGSAEYVQEPVVDVSAVHAGMIIGFPEADGETATPGFVPLEAIGRLYATTPSASVFDRAVNGLSTTVYTPPIDAGTGDVAMRLPDAKISASREKFQEFATAQDGINELYALAIDHAKSRRYKTAEEATSAVDKLVAQMKDIYSISEIYNFQLIVEGEGVIMHPDFILADGKDEYTLEFRRKSEAAQLEEYKEACVILASIVPCIKPVDGPEELYEVSVMLKCLNEASVTPIYSYDGMDMTEMIVKEYAFVPLNGDVIVKVQGYDHMKRTLDQIDDIQDLANGGAIGANVQELYDDLVSTAGKDSISVNGIEAMNKIGEYYSSTSNEQIKDKILQLMAFMFMNTDISLKTIGSTSDVQLNGLVIDVTETPGGALSIVVTDNDNTMHFVPLESFSGAIVG